MRTVLFVLGIAFHESSPAAGSPTLDGTRVNAAMRVPGRQMSQAFRERWILPEADFLRSR